MNFNSSTFYAEFRYVYRIFLLGRVSKIQRNLYVQNCTSRSHEKGRNFPPKCRGVWLSPVFGVRYIPLQSPTIFCQHKWGPLAFVPLFHSHNVLVKPFTILSLTLPRFSRKKSKCDSRNWIFTHIASHSWCTKSTGPAQYPDSSLLCDFLISPCKSS